MRTRSLVGELGKIPYAVQYRKRKKKKKETEVSYTELVWVSVKSANWAEGGDNGPHITPAEVSISGQPII